MKELTKRDYDNYMRQVNLRIETIESDIKSLPEFKFMSKLSHEDWAMLQRGEINRKALRRKYNIKKVLS